jgi:hypothetical protein
VVLSVSASRGQTASAPPKISEHAEDDCSQEGERDDGSQHVQPGLQFHRCLLCRTASGRLRKLPRAGGGIYGPVTPLRSKIDAASQYFDCEFFSFLIAAGDDASQTRNI